jgi:hypothetical protein
VIEWYKNWEIPCLISISHGIQPLSIADKAMIGILLLLSSLISACQSIYQVCNIVLGAGRYNHFTNVFLDGLLPQEKDLLLDILTNQPKSLLCRLISSSSTLKLPLENLQSSKEGWAAHWAEILPIGHEHTVKILRLMKNEAFENIFDIDFFGLRGIVFSNNPLNLYPYKYEALPSLYAFLDRFITQFPNDTPMNLMRYTKFFTWKNEVAFFFLMHLQLEYKNLNARICCLDSELAIVEFAWELFDKLNDWKLQCQRKRKRNPISSSNDYEAPPETWSLKRACKKRLNLANSWRLGSQYLVRDCDLALKIRLFMQYGKSGILHSILFLHNSQNVCEYLVKSHDFPNLDLEVMIVSFCDRNSRLHLLLDVERSIRAFYNVSCLEKMFYLKEKFFWNGSLQVIGQMTGYIIRVSIDCFCKQFLPSFNIEAFVSNLLQWNKQRNNAEAPLSSILQKYWSFEAESFVIRGNLTPELQFQILKHFLEFIPFFPEAQEIKGPFTDGNYGKCPICLDEYSDEHKPFAVQHCNLFPQPIPHYFHKECLQQWGKSTCPYCRILISNPPPSQQA